MVTLDRIRLTGLLTKSPANAGLFYFSPMDLLHVTNGDSVSGTLHATALGGETLSWADVLHEGPVPAVPRSDLLRLRAAFLAECGWGREREIRAVLELRDARFRSALEEGKQVVLWFEHDLFDRLQLADALTLSAETGVLPELIFVDSFPGMPSFHGLGELSPDQLESLWPQRRRVTDEEVDSARAVWDAVRAPQPTALAALSADWATRFLEELPSVENGLSRTERHALEAVDSGAESPYEAFVAAQARESAPFMGDSWFYRVLDQLGAGGERLLEQPLRLTENGRRVLAGEADRVDLLGIDRWVGGTHVTPKNLWRWDSEAQKPVG